MELEVQWQEHDLGGYPTIVLIWEDADSKVWASYNSPEYLQARHRIPREFLQNIAVVETFATKAGE